MKYCVINLGCKVNSYECDFIKERLNEEKYSECTLSEIPDIIVINTCSVTNQSDAKSRHMIRLARRTAPNALIIAVGCSAQNHKDKLLEVGANIVLGNKDKSKVVDYINKYMIDHKDVVKMYDLTNQEFETMFLKSENNKTRAFVKIQDGCDNFCSYCIIPYLRGSIRSKDILLAVEEIKRLVNAGHKEIVLTGIHTGSYGRGKNYDLVDLIRRISVFDDLVRIRISSIEITELDDKFLEELKTNYKICNHLHIPLQSGSDLVLEKMNRKYDTKYFLDKINKIRQIRPDISITTDLIVGFPYENEEEFSKTLDFIKQVEFTKIHTFPFSLRNGTKAEEMHEHFIDEKIKKERVKKVIELSNKLEENYYKKYIGKELSIIVETNKNEGSVGHTDNYILVSIDEKLPSGTKCNVQVTEVNGIYVKGKLIS